MKSRINPLLAGATALVLAIASIISLPTPAQAQTQMGLKIPFDFYVKDKLFEAGSYTVQVYASYIRVSNDHGRNIYALTMPVTNPTWRSMAASGALVFTRYEDHVFLTEVRRSGYSVGNGLSRSSLEAEIARNHPGSTLIAINSK